MVVFVKFKFSDLQYTLIYLKKRICSEIMGCIKEGKLQLISISYYIVYFFN